jgi:hypothetical protein
MWNFLEIATDLELAGLQWTPAIGDEISQRQQPEQISVLVDPQGLSLDELRASFLWLPTVEQMVLQFEARQAILYHAGLNLNHNSMSYSTVIHIADREITTYGSSLRESVGTALRDLLVGSKRAELH